VVGVVELSGIASPYAANAYDALWVAALTENATAGTTRANLKKTLFEIANLHRGITGDLSLNEAGDRKHGDYDFWAIK
jgi:ABC-type branched-subunit amino acid transport system substrate-binding protein